MGSTLVMFIVPDECVGSSALHYADAETGESIRLEKPGMWISRTERERLLRKHPNAYWENVRVPHSAVWEPPEEPADFEWHFDADRLGVHREVVRKSLEDFMNRKLAELDQMVRSGWFIIKRTRAKIVEFEEVPHHPQERRLTPAELEMRRAKARKGLAESKRRRDRQLKRAGAVAKRKPKATRK